MKKKIFAVIILISCGFLSLALREGEKFSRQGFSMDTLINMTVYADDPKILDDAYKLLHRLDKELSMYDPSSDISEINFNAGVKSVKVPDEVVEAVENSLRLYELTDGVFNPLIGPVTKLWKINKADADKIPSRSELDEAVKLSDIKNLEINPDENEIFLKVKGCVLDLGGIAKGYASEKIISLIKNSGIKSALVDLGGNVYVLGRKTDGSEWNIGVRNPLEVRGSPALVLRVHDTAVITSGGYERFKTVGGERYGHFFDASGNSVRNDLLSATVITPDGSLGDGLATAFMAAGYEKSLGILKRLPDDTGVIFIRLIGDDVEFFLTGNLRDVIAASEYKINFIDD